MHQNIIITKYSGIFCLRSTQELCTDIDTAWEFFSSPANLQKITSGDVDFNITSGDQPPIYPGKIITYELKIFPLVKTKWITEITFIQERKYFIDNQISGPYTIWHHEHHFESVASGVLMTDIVHYKLPVGELGNIFGANFVNKKLHNIFSYRYRFLEQHFNASE